MGEKRWWTFISCLVFICANCWLSSVHGGPGTTPNILDIFIGRCQEYQEVASNRVLKPETKDCVFLWEAFKTAFAYKDPRNITREDYEPFFELARQTNIPANRSLLWSGTYEISHRYAADGSRYVTMEDSLIGYLTNGLHWCGSMDKSGSGINFTSCPDWQDLPKAASQSYWGGASSTFAGSATGEIKLVLNGSNPNRAAYDRSSFFANYELPSIKVDLTTVKVILVIDLGVPAREHCDTGSLILLKEDMNNRKLDFVCQENPPDILHLLCIDNPTADECRFQKKNVASLLNPRSRGLVG